MKYNEKNADSIWDDYHIRWEYGTFSILVRKSNIIDSIILTRQRNISYMINQSLKLYNLWGYVMRKLINTFEHYTQFNNIYVKQKFLIYNVN